MDVLTVHNVSFLTQVVSLFHDVWQKTSSQTYVALCTNLSCMTGKRGNRNKKLLYPPLKFLAV